MLKCSRGDDPDVREFDPYSRDNKPLDTPKRRKGSSYLNIVSDRLEIHSRT